MAEQGQAGGRERTAAIVARARAAVAGGCLGSFALPEDLAVIPASGQGSRLWDVDGREYIEYVTGSGPLILGHAHPAVVAADRSFHQRFGAELIRNGIYVHPGQKNYISLAHSDADLGRTLEVYDAAFRTVSPPS